MIRVIMVLIGLLASNETMSTTVMKVKVGTH